jgi:class 3 adenylate cyclase
MMKFSDRVLFHPGENQQSSHHASLFIKFSAITILLILIVSLLLTLLFIKRGKDILYRERVSGGKLIVGHFANQAIYPLLEEDTLTLNTLVKEAKQVDGCLYAMILDSKKIIKAHTDPTKIGLPLKEFENIESFTKDEPITYLTYRLPSGANILNLSKPITFMNKNVGSVFLGLSMDFINNEIKKETFSLVQNVFFVTLFVLIMGIGTTFFLARWLNRSKNMNKAFTTRTERNQVAVLYIGVKGFMAYAAAKKPEEVLQDLNDYVFIATKSILDHGGYVAKIIGDAVIGVFRSSPLEEDYTMRAVRSAVTIQKAFENGRGGRNQLIGNVGIGISSGVVLSGYIGSHAEKMYNYIGESFKAAHSLYVVAGPGEIIISKDIYQSIENLFSVEPIPPREMIQKTEAWESFRLRHMAE